MTQDDERGERERREAEALFERTVRRMLNTPPKPQKNMKLGRSKGRSARPAVSEEPDDGELSAERDGLDQL